MQLTSTARRTHGGFTLVEVLVTLAVLALILMTAVPQIGSWMRNLQIRNAAESVQNGLQRARTEAINRNRPVRFSLVALNDLNKIDNSCTLDATGISWVVSLDDPSGRCGTDPSPTVEPRIITSKAGGDGGKNSILTAIDEDATAAHTLTFDSYGRVVVAPDTIRRIDVTTSQANTDTRSLSVVVTQSGGIRMCDPAVVATDDPRKC